MLFGTLARCVTRNDVVLALALIKHSSTAASYIGVNGSQVFLHDQVRFSREVDQCRKSVISAEIA
eukprot:7250650-Karenia_brevis.AAC.1